MKILIAEDNLFSRRMLRTILQNAGYTVVEAADGQQAWAELQNPEPPRLVILDWMMPGLNGLELCQRIAEKDRDNPVPAYLIMLTSRTDMEDVVQALQSGAHDYITKPFDNEELKARVAIGRRIIELQLALEERLQASSAPNPHAPLLPICSVCKKIRNKGNWVDVEDYMKKHFGVSFSHSLCPACLETHYDKYSG
ncbi:MAG: response regulator [Kiritimatiellae bacterium]|nr:response regulator [Kiritimatiellia bacterium]MDD4734932.1 response regulator [Kiritimatiellia bacterium]